MGSIARAVLFAVVALSVPHSFASGSKVFAQGDDQLPDIISCQLKRSSTGQFRLRLTANSDRLVEGITLTIGGVSPKRLKLKDRQPGTDFFFAVVAKGRVCRGLPGDIVVTFPNGRTSTPFRCFQICPN
ncbi:MAG TPA: hypothetical protein VE262_14795 [Blastocatellia bacterium]|nr:hypothetical protein [Blastocatellia bacterium]